MTLALHTPHLLLLFPSWISSTVHIPLLQTGSHVSFSGVWKTKQSKTNTKQEQPRQIEPWLERIWGLSSMKDGDLKAAAVTPNQTFGSSWGRQLLFFHPRELRVSSGGPHIQNLLFHLAELFTPRFSFFDLKHSDLLFVCGGWDSRFFSPTAFHATELHHVLISFFYCVKLLCFCSWFEGKKALEGEGGRKHFKVIRMITAAENIAFLKL